MSFYENSAGPEFSIIMATPAVAEPAGYTQAERNAIRDATVHVLCRVAIKAGPASATEAMAKFALRKEEAFQAVQKRLAKKDVRIAVTPEMNEIVQDVTASSRSDLEQRVANHLSQDAFCRDVLWIAKIN